MRAIILREHGDITKLETVEKHPIPEIGPKEALIKVKACSLNHLDLWVRNGIPSLRPPLPHILGCDVAGEINALGSKVSKWKIGEDVVVSPGLSCWQCHFCRSGRDNLCENYAILGEHIPGGYAEFVKANESQLIPKPRSLSFEEAAAYPLTFLTAWHMLVTQAGIDPEKKVLILGAGSGVGVAAIQIAKLFGAQTIIVSSSSQEKLDKAISIGATHAILANAEKATGFHREIAKITEGKGVDIVFEHTGSATLPDSIRSVKKGGMIVTCGATTGAQATIDLRYFFSREIRLQGSLMGTLAELKEITRLMGEGKLKPVIDSVFPLAQTRQAHEKMEQRNFFGKIVLRI